MLFVQCTIAHGSGIEAFKGPVPKKFEPGPASEGRLAVPVQNMRVGSWFHILGISLPKDMVRFRQFWFGTVNWQC